MNINGVVFDTNGNVDSPATVTAVTDVKAATISVRNLRVTGVQPGTGNSGTPVI